MINLNRIIELIKQNNSFIITCHVNPDADALGSELAFYYILQKLNKKAKIINHSYTPENHLFLDKYHLVEQYNPSLHDEVINNSDVIVFLDLNSVSRTKSMESVLRNFNKTKICIDHHEYPEDFTENIYVNTQSSSTGEIIYDLIKTDNFVELDYDLAYVLYAAIMTDTGSFRYIRTTAKTHRIIAEFLDLGVIPNLIHEQLFDNSSYGKVKLLGDCLASISVNEFKNVSYMRITKKMILDLGVDESEVDGFVNHCMTIKGIKIGMIFLELADGFKVSLRSRGDIPVNLLAKKYGGGGHLNASGIRFINEGMDKYIPMLVRDAEEIILKK